MNRKWWSPAVLVVAVFFFVEAIAHMNVYAVLVDLGKLSSASALSSTELRLMDLLFLIVSIVLVVIWSSFSDGSKRS